MTAPVPGALSTNTTTACPFCKKEITSHYFYNHISRSHFFDVWGVEANRTRASGAINRSSASCNPLSVEIGPGNYILNPINGRVYTSQKTWEKSLKGVSVADYKASIQAILDYKAPGSANASATSPALDSGEVSAIQKVVSGLERFLKAETRDNFETKAENRALRNALLKFMSEEEIAKIEPEYEEEIEFIDVAKEFRREIPLIKSITVGSEKPKTPVIEEKPKGAPLPPPPQPEPEVQSVQAVPVFVEPKPEPKPEPVITEPVITAPVIGLPPKQLTVPRLPPVTFTPPQPEPVLQFPPVISNTKRPVKVAKKADVYSVA